jgi:uncharacterized membrane protein YhaH (DUF805 family)
MKSCLQTLKKYAVFTGRARRKEWWIFGIVQAAIFFAFKGIDFQLATLDHEGNLGLLSWCYLAATIVPAIAVTVRRLHDTNRSGWWYFIIFLPLVGIIVLLSFMARDGDVGEIDMGLTQRPIAS